MQIEPGAEALPLLIAHGAKLTLTDAEGRTPLETAQDKGYTKLAADLKARAKRWPGVALSQCLVS